jgi:hypothetical protein
VRDRLGAEADSAPLELTPTNQAPVAVLARDDGTASPMQATLAGPPRAPLWSTVRVSGAGSSDPDSDRLTYVFSGRAPGGGELVLTACPDRPAEEPVRCFVLEQPGAHTLTLTVSDGSATSPPSTLVVTAAEDAPPCIAPDGLEPDPVRTPLVILAADEAMPRSFEVKRVLDDGHPLPPGPRGRAGFVWYVEQGRGWERLTGYDRPEREIGPALFDDVRPGKTFSVRVVVQDPPRSEPRAVRALEDACKDRELCEEPKGCLRWATWKVRVQ